MKQKRRGRNTVRFILSISVITLTILCNGFISAVRPTAVDNASVLGASNVRYKDIIFPAVTVKHDITYGKAIAYKKTTEVKLKLDLYQPTGDAETKRPAIIWIHGGSFVIGDKASYEGLATQYAKRGYVAASINYRLADHEVKKNDPEAPAIIQMAKYDALAAVRWMRANAAKYNIDPNKIIVAGHSAGAVTALYAAYDTQDVGQSGTPNVASTVAAAVSVAGAIMPDKQSSIQTGDPPSIMLHGELDSTVPYEYAQQTEAKLTAATIPHLWYHYPNVKHNMIGATHVDQHIYDFLYDYVITKTIVIPGDMDGNGQVNIIDYTLFFGYWTFNNVSKADMNSDGKLNVIDFTLFMNFWHAAR